MNDKMENCINGFRFYYMNQWIDQMTRYIVCSQVRKAFIADLNPNLPCKDCYVSN